MKIGESDSRMDSYGQGQGQLNMKPRFIVENMSKAQANAFKSSS